MYQYEYLYNLKHTYMITNKELLLTAIIGKTNHLNKSVVAWYSAVSNITPQFLQCIISYFLLFIFQSCMATAQLNN